MPAHLAKFRRRLRSDRKDHLTCSRAKCHTIDEVALSLHYHHDRIKLPVLPAEKLVRNPIERLSGHLREKMTKNHPRKSMQNLRNGS